jgi:hypothetical protein
MIFNQHRRRNNYTDLHSGVAMGLGGPINERIIFLDFCLFLLAVVVSMYYLFKASLVVDWSYTPHYAHHMLHAKADFNSSARVWHIACYCNLPHHEANCAVFVDCRHALLLQLFQDFLPLTTPLLMPLPVGLLAFLGTRGSSTTQAFNLDLVAFFACAGSLVPDEAGITWLRCSCLVDFRVALVYVLPY